MKLKNNSRILVAMTWISLFALAQPVLGQSELDELPVVLSASRLKQSPLRAPAGVTVIDRETIIATGARQIVDVLRLVPGVVVQYPRGYWATVGMRGFGEFFGRNLQVLIDGVSVYNPMWSGVDWSEIPLSPYEIERVEVIRGPNAAT
jgi:iron complex outermembrane receptor protein